MHTDTAMDYIDSQTRLFRGGACYTTVPAINVVAEKHYAWALPIAAGIATNRNGVPWGYLGSVNDVFKSPSSDRDQSMAFAHPEVSGGAFTYTAIHEASHYLGLAHPHDSIGATRNADGSPRYYDGFTWAYNSTASPTTYSHTELVYSILDQENIARGHTAYYLKWADEGLSEGGVAYASRGVTQVGLLPAKAARLRQQAIDNAKRAETLFARFDFVNATFAAQKAWRSAAAYRDLALGLAPGTASSQRARRRKAPRPARRLRARAKTRWVGLPSWRPTRCASTGSRSRRTSNALPSRSRTRASPSNGSTSTRETGARSSR